MGEHAAIGVARFVISLMSGGALYLVWTQTRPNDPEYYSIIAGVGAFILLWVLIIKMK